jgi:hypothetical protein
MPRQSPPSYTFDPLKSDAFLNSMYLKYVAGRGFR